MMPVVVTVIPAVTDPAAYLGGCSGRHRWAMRCGDVTDPGKVRADIETAMTTRWLSYAVTSALAGRMPYTMAFVVPTRTGGVPFPLGAGRELVRPMAFGGAVDTGATVHEALNLPRVTVEEEEVLLDDFDGLAWPMWCVKGATA